MMEKLTRRDKLFLDVEKTKESAVNRFLECRDGIVECYEYNADSGYGAKTRLFLCENTKHESTSIIRQAWDGKEWNEEEMSFDTDSFEYLRSLVGVENFPIGGKYTLVRDYNTES